MLVGIDPVREGIMQPPSHPLSTTLHAANSEIRTFQGIGPCTLLHLFFFGGGGAFFNFLVLCRLTPYGAGSALRSLLFWEYPLDGIVSYALACVSSKVGGY